MLLTPHAALGAAIGAKIESPWIVAPLSFASHFLLDAIPHTDWGMWHGYKENFQLDWRDYLLVAVDFSLTITMICYLWLVFRDINMILGIVFAILPDLIDNVPYLKKYIRRTTFGRTIHNIHTKVHYYLDAKKWIWGVVSQFLIIFLAFWAIII